MIMNKLLITLFFSISLSLRANSTDFIVFSYNRPMQLYALLESSYKYISGLHKVFVIYRAGNKEFEQGYEIVKEAFPEVNYLAQSSNPHKDFKPLVLRCFFATKAPYIMFGVDDIIVKDYIDLKKDIELLKQTKAYGMYYRLGHHLTQCYSMNRRQSVPSSQHIEGDVFQWRFKKGIYDWNYPHTVDMTLYKKTNVQSFFKAYNYYAPNPLEAKWAIIKPAKSTGLFYTVSKIVNLPMNLVQEGNNRHTDVYTAQDLLKKFNQGLKIDIAPFFRMKNKAAHSDSTPTFVQR